MSAWRARSGLITGVLAWLATFWFLSTAAVRAVPTLGDEGAVTDNLDAALGALAAVLGLALLAWVGVAFVATTLTVVLPRGGVLSGVAHRLGDVVTPAAARRTLAVALAAALVSGAAPARAATSPAGSIVATTAPASTGQGSTAPPSTQQPLVSAFAGRPPRAAPQSIESRSDARLDPGWGATLSSPAMRGVSLDPAWGTPGRVRPDVEPESAVVVRRGDTLWDIAARHLGPHATDPEIARAWPLWFEANRSTIGPDPDRLTPGQRLKAPVPTPGGPR